MVAAELSGPAASNGRLPSASYPRLSNARPIAVRPRLELPIIGTHAAVQPVPNVPVPGAATCKRIGPMPVLAFSARQGAAPQDGPAGDGTDGQFAFQHIR